MSICQDALWEHEAFFIVIDFFFQGESLLGRKAEEMYELRENSRQEFQAVLSAAQFSEKTMLIRSNTSYALPPSSPSYVRSGEPAISRRRVAD